MLYVHARATLLIQQTKAWKENENWGMNNSKREGFYIRKMFAFLLVLSWNYYYFSWKKKVLFSSLSMPFYIKMNVKAVAIFLIFKVFVKSDINFENRNTIRVCWLRLEQTLKIVGQVFVLQFFISLLN